MKCTSNIYCRQIVNIIKEHGVKLAYCCPGSRNAPLLIALESISSIKKIVVTDERSAAFQALGSSLVKNFPVLLVCTSGTAILNFAPAIAEAFYSGVPLIVVSADRPKEWIDQDDSQTIRQTNILNNIVKGSYDIRAIPEGGIRKEYTEEMMWTVNRTVNEAMIMALNGKPGPVHINVQLSEPLGEMEEYIYIPERFVSLVNRVDKISLPTIKKFAESASNAKILIVVGFSMPLNAIRSSVARFATLPNVAVMCETLSNLHDPQPLSTMIDSVLCGMNDDARQLMRPDIVISFGGSLVSRMLKKYLRDYPPRYHWSIGYTNYFCDCFKSLTEVIDVAPQYFFRQLFFEIRKLDMTDSPEYGLQWYKRRKEALIKSEKYIEDAPWSDLKAIDYLLKNLTLDNLFVSNGTSVRYSQLIPHTCHAEYCNRGVSGIDGSTATAVGGANVFSGKTTLITGDLSWLYDSGASTLFNVSVRMRIVVIDNSGGGIFRFIKSTSGIPKSILDKYFCVGDLPDIGVIASAYGIEVIEAHNMDELKNAVLWLDEDSENPRLLVLHTNPLQSNVVLTNYFKNNF